MIVVGKLDSIEQASSSVSSAIGARWVGIFLISLI